jgi:hypothetical protein
MPTFGEREDMKIEHGIILIHLLTKVTDQQIPVCCSATGEGYLSLDSSKKF